MKEIEKAAYNEFLEASPHSAKMRKHQALPSDYTEDSPCPECAKIDPVPEGFSPGTVRHGISKKGVRYVACSSFKPGEPAHQQQCKF